MDENKFFKFLWRANAVSIFIVAIGVIVLMFLALGDLRIHDTPPPISNQSIEATLSEEKFEIRIPHNLKKVDHYMYFEMRSGVDSYGKFSGGSQSQIRNIAIHNLNTNATEWIFDSAQQEIESYIPVVESVKSQGGDKKNISITRGFLLTVASSRTDGTIVRDVWVMRPDGQDFRKILSNISRRVRIEGYRDNQVKLLLEADEQVDVYPFDLDALTIGEAVSVSLP